MTSKSRSDPPSQLDHCKPKLNRFDRLILRGRDAYSCAPLIYFERLRVASIAAIVILAIGVGWIIWTQHEADLGRCRERNERSVLLNRQLERLVAAHRADGNMGASRAWAAYLRESADNPLPRCG